MGDGPARGAPGFNRSEQEEEEVWKAQYEVGSQIQAALERAFQLHKMTDFKISSVSALPRDSFISDLICASSAYTLHPQRLRQISREERRAGPAALRGEVARAAEHHSDRATRQGQHLGVRPGGVRSCAEGGAGPSHRGARCPEGRGGAEGPRGRAAQRHTAAEGRGSRGKGGPVRAARGGSRCVGRLPHGEGGPHREAGKRYPHRRDYPHRCEGGDSRGEEMHCG